MIVTGSVKTATSGADVTCIFGKGKGGGDNVSSKIGLHKVMEQMLLKIYDSNRYDRGGQFN